MYVFDAVRDTMKTKKSAMIASAGSRRRSTTSRRRDRAAPPAAAPSRGVRSEDAATAEMEGVQWDLVNRPHTRGMQADMMSKQEGNSLNPLRRTL